MAHDNQILLTQQQHADLNHIAQSRALPAGFVFRAKLILMLAEGASFNAIKRQLPTTAPTIIRWKQRFRRHGLGGKKGTRKPPPLPKYALVLDSETTTEARQNLNFGASIS